MIYRLHTNKAKHNFNNFVGTANVIQACVEENVAQLVYTSTVDVVIGYDDIINGDEALTVPKKFLFHGYPETKHRAETLVTEANGRKLAKGLSKFISYNYFFFLFLMCIHFVFLPNLGDGSVLHTLSLRPNVMYGELDPYYVTSGLVSAKQNNGTLLRIGNGTAKFQQVRISSLKM